MYKARDWGGWWNEFEWILSSFFLASLCTELAGEVIPMVMKINTGLGNPCPFQEPLIYEVTSFLYKSPYLDLVHITVYLTWFPEIGSWLGCIRALGAQWKGGRGVWEEQRWEGVFRRRKTAWKTNEEDVLCSSFNFIHPGEEITLTLRRYMAGPGARCWKQERTLTWISCIIFHVIMEFSFSYFRDSKRSSES